MKRKYEQILNTGGFGEVSKNIWKNMPDELKRQYSSLNKTKISDDTVVAIKTLNKYAFERPESRALFDSEIAIHRTLNHPNIVSFIGVLETAEPAKKALVMEFMSCGDLTEIPEHVLIDNKLSIAMDIAKGLDYLHSLMKIVHRDIKPDNVLIKYADNAIQAKICDFGFAAPLESVDFHYPLGTKGYIAPEILRVMTCIEGNNLRWYKRTPLPLPYSFESDIFSYAMVLAFMADQIIPDRDFNSTVSGIRRQIPNNIPVNYAKIICYGWDNKPEHRPQMPAIIKLLEEAGNSDMTADWFEAVQKGNAGLVRYFIEKNINPLLENDMGQTAMEIWPPECVHDNPFKLLLNRLQNKNVKWSKETAALLDSILTRSAHLLKLRSGLYQASFDNYLIALLLSKKPEIIEQLTSHKQWPVVSQFKTGSGYTLLHAMAFFGRDDLFKYLEAISSNDVDNVDNINQQSALHLAAKTVHPGACHWLADHKANLNLQDKFGETALAYAAYNRNSEICRFLLEQGANPELVNNNGLTAAQWWDIQDDDDSDESDSDESVDKSVDENPFRNKAETAVTDTKLGFFQSAESRNLESSETSLRTSRTEWTRDQVAGSRQVSELSSS